MSCFLPRFHSLLVLGILLSQVTGPTIVLGQEKAEKEEAVKKELAALQGTWRLKAGEDGGKEQAPEELKRYSLVFDGSKVTFKQDSETVAEGKADVDPMKSPKHMTIKWNIREQPDVIIFIRVGNFLTMCGRRNGGTRPTEFASGTEKGGEFLNVWEREK
jgi:uncharacterized protein (TIGR03067 family)